MMRNKKEKKIKDVLVTNPTNYMESFRTNIDNLSDTFDYTVKELAEKADMSVDTLKSFIYGDAKDCKLSTAVKLSKVFGISIDELVGADTINGLSKESLSICRNLPEHSLYLVRQFIRHQGKIYENHIEQSKIISILKPDCANGHLLTTNVVEPLCIDHLTNNVKSKVALGMKIPCEHYMPYYSPYDTILIAADREAVNNEKCVVAYKGNYFIVVKKSFIENGQKKWKYVSLINEKTEVLQSDIDDKLGYIVGFLNPDGSWGIR